MAENKSSFIFYTEWKQDFEFLTDEEAGKLMKHLLRYVSDEDPSFENEDRLLQFAAQKIKNVLKKDLKKYQEVCEKRAEAGKKGGVSSGKSRTSKQTEAKEAIALMPKQNEHDNEYEYEYDNEYEVLLKKEPKDDDVTRDENFDLKQKAKHFLKAERAIQMDRLKMHCKLSDEILSSKIDEFVDKKFDWEENTWKDDADMAKNFEFWLGKNAKVVLNPYKDWTDGQFHADCKLYEKEFGKKVLTDFYRYWKQKTEVGIMRFQEKNAWETKEQLKIWKSKDGR